MPARFTRSVSPMERRSRGSWSASIASFVTSTSSIRRWRKCRREATDEKLLVIVSDDAQRALWLKFMILAPHATITSACGEPIGTIRALPEGAALYRQLIGETAAVGRAAGVALPADVVATTVDFIMNLPPAAS